MTSGAAILAICQEEPKPGFAFRRDLGWGIASLSCNSKEVDRAELSLGEKYAVVVWPAPKMRLDSKQNRCGKGSEFSAKFGVSSRTT